MSAIATNLLSFYGALSGEDETSMAIFHVYCDESGKLADSSCVAFAACVFTADEVPGFTRRWNEILADAGIRYLSMKEAMNFRGEFKNWGNRANDRDSLVETLGKLLIDRGVFQTVSVMDTALFKGLAMADQERFKNPVYAGFETLMKSIVDDAGRRFKKPEHRFHLVYDLSEEYAVQCLRLYNKLRTMGTVYRQFLPSIAFADDMEFPPLQGADVVAYCGREEFIHGTDQCGPLIQRLLETFRSYREPETRYANYKSGDSLGDATLED